MRPNDPYRKFNFIAEFDGLAEAAFQSVTGLTAQTQATTYRNGNEPPWFRKLSGLTTFAESNIVLMRGYTQADSPFWAWHQAILNGDVQRRDGSIILLDEARKDRIRWDFREGWLCSIQGAELDAGSNEVAMLRAEICVEHLSTTFLG